MADDLDNLEYYIKFPNPNFIYNKNEKQTEDIDFIFIINENKIPVIILFGWAGCQDRYLMKYSQIYEKKGLITIRYTAPVKCLFWKRSQMEVIGDKLVKLLLDLNFDNHPIIIHCFSNGGAFLYQNFIEALARCPNKNNLLIKGVIFDSAPGRRRLISLYRAVSAILGGKRIYNIPATFCLTIFLSIIWLYDIIKNVFTINKNLKKLPSNPLENLKDEQNQWPQHFIYSKNDNLIFYKDIEYFSNYRKNLGISVTTLCYENSPHVKHYSENKDSYVTSIYNFLNKCLK